MNIEDTGVRGYLKWLRQDQPALYVRAAPVIAQRVPEAFSDREQSMAMGALMGLADDDTDPELENVSFDASSFALPTDINFDTSGSDSTDVASAANTGAASAGVVGAISGIINALSAGAAAKSQLDTLNQVNQIQLQRAAAGLSPLNTSSLSLGVQKLLGSGTATAAGGGLLLVVALGIGLLALRK